MYLFKFNFKIVHKFKKSYIMLDIFNKLFSFEFMNVNVDLFKFKLLHIFIKFIIIMLNEFKFCIKKFYKKNLI